MPTIDATVGGTDANSYVTDAEADTYFDERLNASAWTGENDEDAKARALIQATRRIDVFAFEGVQVDTAQALKWPRIEAFDPDGYEYEGIPSEVKRATYELALHLLNQTAAGTDPYAPTGLEGFNRAKVGPLDVEINHSHSPAEVPDIIRGILAPTLRSAGFMATLERR